MHATEGGTEVKNTVEERKEEDEGEAGRMEERMELKKDETVEQRTIDRGETRWKGEKRENGRW